MTERTRMIETGKTYIYMELEEGFSSVNPGESGEMLRRFYLFPFFNKLVDLFDSV